MFDFYILNLCLHASMVVNPIIVENLALLFD